jgi:hypothetical protein
MNRLLPILIISLLTHSRPSAAQEVSIFEHPENWAHPEQLDLTEKDILFKDPFTKLFGSRAFHFLGCLDNGTQYVINVFHWEYAFLGGWGMSVMVIEPDGSAYICEQRIPEQEVSVAEERFHITVGSSIFEGADGSYRVRINQDDFYCDLQVRSMLPLWQPGDGYVFLTKKRDVFMRLGVHSPWAVTRGYMVVRGRWMSADGQCYGDRSRHSYPISKISSPALAFRGFSPARISSEERWFLSVLQYTSHRSYGSKTIPIMILAHGGRWVFTTKDYSLTTGDFRNSEMSKLAYPHCFTLSAARNGYALQGRFVVTDLYHLTDIFAKLPAVFRPLVSLFFKRPVIFRMVGYFEGTVTGPSGSTEQLYLPGQCEYSILY